MARHASTYRQMRRALWRILKTPDQTWEHFNAIIKRDDSDDGKRYGPVRSDYAGGAHFLGGRSK